MNKEILSNKEKSQDNNKEPEEFLSEKEQMMVILAFLAYTDATIPVGNKTPWKIFEDINKSLLNIIPAQKIVWGPAIDVSWMRSINGFPMLVEYMASLAAKPHSLITHLIRSNMFPQFSPALKSFRKRILESHAFEGLVSLTRKTAIPLMDMANYSHRLLRSSSLFSTTFMYIVEGHTEQFHSEKCKKCKESKECKKYKECNEYKKGRECRECKEYKECKGYKEGKESKECEEYKKYNECKEYTVIIRGADPFSITSLFSAFDISSQVVWNHEKILADNHDTIQPSEDLPCISRGTYHSLKHHLTMVPRPGFYSAGITIVNFIKEKIKENENRKVKINFTGHSLGAILMPSFALWIYEELKKEDLLNKVEFKIYTFAPMTPGNKKLVDYIEEVFGENYCGYVNGLDPAPYMFQEDGIEKLLDLYKDADIEPDPFIVEFVNFIETLVHKRGYTHMKNQKKITSAIYSGASYGYMGQTIYQHIYPYIIAVQRAMGNEGYGHKSMNAIMTDLYAAADALYESCSSLYPFI